MFRAACVPSKCRLCSYADQHSFAHNWPSAARRRALDAAVAVVAFVYFSYVMLVLNAEEQVPVDLWQFKKLQLDRLSVRVQPAYNRRGSIQTASLSEEEEEMTGSK